MSNVFKKGHRQLNTGRTWFKKGNKQKSGEENPNWKKDAVRGGNCEWCKEYFSFRRPSEVRRFCSVRCAKKWEAENVPKDSFRKGKAPKIKRETYDRFKTERLGEGNPNWKGDKVSKKALHDWIRWNYGEKMECEKCGSKNAKVYDWSNISGEYKRDRSDWQRLCRSCHQKYDYKVGMRKPSGKHKDR